MDIGQLIFTTFLGLVAGAFAARWQNEKLSAETAKIYQDIAAKEREEREKLEDRLKSEIESLTERLGRYVKRVKDLEAEKELWTEKEQQMELKIQRLSTEIKQWKKDTGNLPPR